MGFKSKVFGFVAAAALSMTLISSAGAADVDSKARFVGGNCSITVAGTGDTKIFNLGRYTWNGTGYVVDSSTVNNTISGQITSGNPSNCELSMTGSALTVSGESRTIPASSMNYSMSVYALDPQTTTTRLDYGYSKPNVPTSGYGLTISFNENLGNPLTGLYEGNVTLTVSNEAP